MADVITPYSTVAGLGVAPTWINEYDRQRYLAYSIYDDVYKNVEGTFALVSRGTENKPVYIPTARTIINTLARYTAVSPALTVTGPSEPAVAAAQLAFNQLLKRERFWSRFNSNKMLGMRRGDWLWHVVANPLKPEGSRISIYALDPRQYFKITDPTDVDRVVGCDIIEQIVEGDKTFVKKQRYTKGIDSFLPEEQKDGLIYSSVTIHEVEQWEDPTKAPVRTVTPPTALPPTITALPVYHIPHNEEVGDPYGISDLQGFERVLAEIIQSTSDESLALALEGLGMYATTSGPPRDSETGREVPWRLGPGRVVEIPENASFDRVDGIGSVAPYQDHLSFVLEHGVARPSGLTDAAMGKVDAAVAESGIALALQLAPTLAQTERNDTTIKEIMDQMFYDLKIGWLPAYEGIRIDEATNVEVSFGNKIPVNRKEQITELNDMFDKGIIDSVYYREQMSQFGYQFPEGMAMAVAQERKEMLDAISDPELNRAEGELAAP